MTSASLGGVALPAPESVGWRFTRGVQPYQRVFELAREDAQALFDRTASAEVTLRYERDGVESKVEALTILSVVAVDHPDRLGLLVTDRRWAWSHHTVRRDMNVRRRTGEMRLVDGVLQRIPPADDISFARYSLKDEAQEWDVESAIRDVAEQVTLGRYRLDIKAEAWVRELDIDGFVLRDNGASAMARVLGLVPDLGVWIDNDGTAIIDSASDGREGAEIKASGPSVVGPSLVDLVDLSHVRPEYVEVLFGVEEECRFDFTEDPADGTVDNVTEEQVLENVIQLPDALTIAGKRYEIGAWVTITQALLDAWNETAPTVSIGGQSVRLPPLTFTIIRNLWMSPGGYNAYLEFGGSSGTQLWARRWLAMLQHYRQTFRISRRWADRCYGMRVSRLAIVDPETGTAAPSDVFADHCVVPTLSRIARSQNDETLKLALNVTAWADGDTSRLLSTGRPAAGATVTVKDEDAFIFQVAFRPPTGQPNILRVLPSAANPDTIPSADPTQALFLLQQMHLATTHRLSIVVTLIPASPQGNKGFWRLQCKPGDAAEFLPSAMRPRVQKCLGPPRQVFAGIAPARFAATDASQTETSDAILRGKPRSPSRVIDPEHLSNIALSYAASVYSSLADRWEGTKAVAFDPNRKPIGRIKSVSHELAPSGEFVTALDLSGDVQPIDVMALLPESTRRKLFGKVQT